MVENIFLKGYSEVTKQQIAEIARKHEIPDCYIRMNLPKDRLVRNIISHLNNLYCYAIVGDRREDAKMWKEKLSNLKTDLGVK